MSWRGGAVGHVDGPDLSGRKRGGRVDGAPRTRYVVLRRPRDRPVPPVSADHLHPDAYDPGQLLQRGVGQARVDGVVAVVAQDEHVVGDTVTAGNGTMRSPRSMKKPGLACA